MAETRPTDPAFAIRPPAGFACIVCDRDIADDENFRMVEQARFEGAKGLGSLSHAAVVCPACWQRAIDQDGSPDQLIAGLQKDRVPPAPTSPAATLSLARRKLKDTKYPRRHPSGHERLLEHPPADGDHLVLIVSAENVGHLRNFERLLVVETTSKPEFLDLRAANGRKVIVGHLEADDPRWLIRLAQALIDHGSTEVEMRTIGPGTKSSDHLQIIPEAQ